MKSLLTIAVLVPLFFLTGARSTNRRYPERLYDEGVAYLENGDDLNTKNSWRKYLAYCRLNPEDCRISDIEKVEAFFSHVLPTSPAPVVSEVEENLQAPLSPIVNAPPARLPVKKIKSKSTTIAPSKVDVDSLVEQAKRAKEQGQLEYALRLYQLAEQVHSDKEEFHQQIEELKKEME